MITPPTTPPPDVSPAWNMLTSFMNSASSRENGTHFPVSPVDFISFPEIRALALHPSTARDAYLALHEAHYDINERTLTRKGTAETGEGFWESSTANQEIIYHGPGEYRQPSYQEVTQTFFIRSGGCHIWISHDNGNSWIYDYCDEKLTIPENRWYCLATGNDGICMHTDKSSERATHRLNGRTPSSNCQMTIQELISLHGY